MLTLKSQNNFLIMICSDKSIVLIENFFFSNNENSLVQAMEITN